MVTTLEAHWTNAFAWLATRDIIMIIINMRGYATIRNRQRLCNNTNEYMRYAAYECQGHATYTCNNRP